MERRLSAILAADMVGFSRLMESDEVGTLQRQKIYRAELIDPNIKDYHGRIVKEMGDGLLVEFPSVVEAVQCAVIIQREMNIRETNTSHDQRIQYRVGINLGDIIIEDDDIFGEGVNIAARLEQMAEPGSICISGTAYDHLKSNIEVGYESLGDVQVKNIERPIRAYKVLTDHVQAGETIGEKGSGLTINYRVASIVALLLIAIVSSGGWWWSKQPDFEPVNPVDMILKLPENPSIAVLPFDYLGPEKSDNEYLADGFSENITAYLAKIPDMLVIARNSSFTFKGKAIDVREVSKKFGVRYVLEGSIQRTGDKLRVTAQLIDAVAGKHIWAETYDRDANDLFAIQDEITLEIIRKISDKTVTGNFLAKHQTGNIAAYIEQRKGYAAQLKFTRDGNILARKYYTAALNLYPNNLVVFNLIGLSHFMDARMGIAKDPGVSLKLAEQYINKTLAIDDEYPYSISVLAIIRIIQKRGDKALELAKRAAELAPNDAAIIGNLAWVLKYAGDAEGSLKYFKKAKRLQPVQQSWLIVEEYGAHIDTGKYAAALELTEDLLKLAPIHRRSAYMTLPAIAQYKVGNQKVAKSMIKKALILDPQLSIASMLAFDSAHIDRSIPEKKYAILRLLGLQDTPPQKLPDKPSIAVLPFANMSNDPAQEYFVDGMTDDLITRLANVSGMFVIARNSVFTYKGKNVKVQNVGRDLGVRYVLEGSVRYAGGKIRINAQLIDATTGGHLWAEIFDRDASDIFDLQDEVSAKIVEALKIKLTPDEQTKLADKPTYNMKAYDRYLRARDLHLKFDSLGGGLKKALKLYQEAITLDPKFADAYAHNAELTANIWRLSMLSTLSRREALKKAQNSIANTLRIEPENAIAIRVQALILSSNGRHEEAIAKAQTAVFLKTGDASSHFLLAFVLANAGNIEEARTEIDLATRADPNPNAQDLKLAGWVYFATYQYSKATSSFQKSIKLTPKSVFGNFNLAASAAKEGQMEVVKLAVENIRKRAPSVNWRWQEFTHGNLQPEVLKHYIDALKQANIPEWPFGFVGVKIDQLSEEEFRKLFFGHRNEGAGKTWGTYEATVDKEGRWTFLVHKFGNVSKGQFHFKNGKTCYIFEGGLKGLEICYNVYRNPTGTLEDRNEYMFADVFDLYSFSVVD